MKNSLYLNNGKKPKIVNLKDKSTDFIFWNSKSEIERLQAIEILKQQYINNMFSQDFREFI